MLRRLALGLSCLVVFTFLAHDFASAQGRRHRRTIIVNPVPGDPIRSGDRLLRSLTRASSATAFDPWLVKIEAGTYDVQGTSVVMLPFVDIEGSGQGITKIAGEAPDAVVLGAEDAELRNLTVEQSGAGATSAVRNLGDRFRMHRVTTQAIGGATNGFLNVGNDTVVNELTARVTGVSSGGTAVSNHGERASWHNVSATITGSGINYAFFNTTDSEFSHIIAESVSSDAFAGGIRNEAGSPIMRNVRVFANGVTGQAITNGASSNAKLYDVFARAEGSAQAFGINNEFGDPVLKNIDVRAESPAQAVGVQNLFGGTVTMYGVTSVGISGGFGRGLATVLGSRSVAHHSTFEGDGNSVANDFDPASRAEIGTSQLIGPASAGSGSLKCVLSYDGSFNPLMSSCAP